MAGITFRGRSAVQNHHLVVPYRELVPEASKSRSDAVCLDDNLIIHGDNLEALKALLPTHAGRIKCVYIDPPYNTGNEGWIYNDRVESPLIRDWLGKTVDREDLTRHDKWLAMMMPRVRLIRELMADNGVIFVSIDDNELPRLTLLLDEIFGEENFIANIVVQLNPRGRTLDRFFAKTHEYVLCYAKNAEDPTSINLLPKSDDAMAEYRHQDADGRHYRLLELRNRNPVFNRENRPNLYYPIYVDPDSGAVSIEAGSGLVEVLPQNSRGVDGCWTWGRDRLERDRDQVRGQQVRGGGWRIYRKDYAHDEEGNQATTKAKALWLDRSLNNENGKEVLADIFDGQCPFDFPKSVDLVKTCVELGSSPGDIVLDSFAGSGTTGQAVAELNLDETNPRKYILVEFGEYADSITAERMRRLGDGVPGARREIIRGGLPSTFSFFELGATLDYNRLLDGQDLPSFEDLARYLFYTATGRPIVLEEINQDSGFIGETEQYRVFLFYQPDLEWLRSGAFTLDRARDLGEVQSGRTRLVFAPSRYLDADHLREMNIQFCQLPYDIFRLKG